MYFPPAAEAGRSEAEGGRTASAPARVRPAARITHTFLEHVYIFPVQNVLEILSVLVFLEDFVCFQDFLAGDPSVAVGDFLEAGNLAVLVCFDRLDEVSGVDKALMGSGVQPCEALAEQLDMELFVVQIDPVEIGDLIFTACGGLKVFGIFHHAAVVEVQSGHAVIALGMGGFLLDGDSISVFVEFHNAKALGVVDIITENSCSFALLCFLNGCAESFPKTRRWSYWPKLFTLPSDVVMVLSSYTVSREWSSGNDMMTKPSGLIILCSSSSAFP